MKSRKGAITFKGQPMTLLGEELAVGQPAPDFTAVKTDLSPLRLADYKGETIVISAVPSVDTGVCAAQTNRFNQEAAGMNAQVITISLDLPFALKRFCGDNDIENLIAVSDYQDREFAAKYGLLIDELKLLARAVFIVDKQGNLAYQQLVPEVAQEPEYDEVLAKVKELAG